MALAVQALHILRTSPPWAGQPHLSVRRLVLAGGYDERLAENREYFSELQQQIGQLGLDEQVSLSVLLAHAVAHLSHDTDS